MGLGGAALTSSGCAAILHPDRQGNPPGPVAVGPLVLDILWFIPGIVPGIIAIAVDFGTGAIYLPRGYRAGGGRSGWREPTRLAIAPGERITVRPPAPDVDVDVALRLVGPGDVVLDEGRGRWSPDGQDELRVALAERPERPGHGEPHRRRDGRLELVARRHGRTSVVSHPLRLRAARA